MAKLTINIGAKLDGMKRGLASARSRIKKWSSEISGLTKLAFGTAFVGLGAGITSIIKKSAKLAAQFEQIKVAFTTMTGSASRAKDLISELNEFSKATPFSPDQVFKAGKTLLAFGFAAREVKGTLKLLGDVSAGTGKDLGEMAVIFGQIKGAGRLMGQDLLQLINAGFNPLQTISEKTGKSMSQLKDEMSKGLITFDQVEGAFRDATSEGGLFFNMMEKQSQTLNGQLSTLEGNVKDLMRQFGELTLPELKVVVTGLGEAVKGLQELAIARAALEAGDVETETGMGKEIAANAYINGLEMAAKFFLPFDDKIAEVTEKIRAKMLEASEISAGPVSKEEVAEKRAADAKEAADIRAKEDAAALAAQIKAEQIASDDRSSFEEDMMDIEDFGLEQLNKDLAIGDKTIAKNKEEAKRAEEKAAKEAADKLQANIGAAFQPGGKIQSRLARIGGERTISVDRQIPQQQLAVQKQMLAVAERVAMAVEDYDGPTFPG
jgi:tape measure domain-containing protein